MLFPITAVRQSHACVFACVQLGPLGVRVICGGIRVCSRLLLVVWSRGQVIFVWRCPQCHSCHTFCFQTCFFHGTFFVCVVDILMRVVSVNWRPPGVFVCCHVTATPPFIPEFDRLQDRPAVFVAAHASYASGPVPNLHAGAVATCRANLEGNRGVDKFVPCFMHGTEGMQYRA